jgi:hypothetical protein
MRREAIKYCIIADSHQRTPGKLALAEMIFDAILSPGAVWFLPPKFQ